eukprot:s148_g13.t1
MIRAVINHGVQRNWGASVCDVRTAFLLAPRPKPEGGREVIVVPPKVMVQAGLIPASERWRVHKALYGFTSSPAHWSAHRDRTMKTFQWLEGEWMFYLRPTEEANLWKIWKVKATEEGCEGSAEPECVGHLIVYVDDMMVWAERSVRLGFLKRLEQEWKISAPEHVDDQKWVRFCGFELKWADENRLQVAQPSYTRDLLQRHGVKTKKAVPMSKIEVPEALEEAVTAEEIKAAQALTGELLWLAIRSRPDISFAVAQIGRQVSKRPRWAVQVGQGILEYLAGTPDLGLTYEGRQGDRGPEGNLPIPRHERLIESFSDISFAPQGERSLQGSYKTSFCHVVYSRERAGRVRGSDGDDSDEPLRNTEVGDREPENQDFLPDVVAGADMEWRETETADELKVKAATVVSSLKKWVNVPIVGEVTEKVKAFVAVVFTLLVMSLVVRLKRLENPDWPGLDQQSLDELSSILEALGTLDEMIAEEKQTRAIGRQDFQEVRENEPTLRKVEVVPRENEPGSTQGLTHENPEGTKVLGREPPKSVVGFGTQKGLWDSNPGFGVFGSGVAGTGSGGAAEPSFEPFFPVVSGSNHCPEGCPGSFRACALRLRDAMASTASGGAGGDEPDEGRPDKSWVKGDYEPGPSKKKKKKKGKGLWKNDEQETAEDQLEPVKKAKREEPTTDAVRKGKEPTTPTEAPGAAPGTPVVILGEAAPSTPPLYPLVDAAGHGFDRRTVEWGYYTPEGVPMVIVPSSPDQSEEPEELMGDPAGSTEEPAVLTGSAEEPEEEVPPEDPSKVEQPEDRSDKDREKKEKKKKKEEEIERLPVIEKGPRDPPPDPPAPALKLAALRMPCGVGRDEGLGQRHQVEENQAAEEKPRERVEFQRPPSGKKDEWTPQLKGWVIRKHGALRERRFHPLHRGVPFDPNCLEALRVTIAFGQDGRRTIHQDRWSDGPKDLFPTKEPWRGFKFFKLRNPEGKQDGTGQVPRYHVGEDGPLPYVPTQEPFGPTTTSSSTSNAAAAFLCSTARAAAAESSSSTAAAAESSSSTAAAAVSGAALRWGYRRGDAAERGRVVVSQIPQTPARIDESSGEWSVIEEV